MERPHILEKYLVMVKEISLLYIKWDFLLGINWACISLYNYKQEAYRPDSATFIIIKKQCLKDR